MLPLYWHPWRNVIVDNKNRPDWASRFHLFKWIDTICCQRNSSIMRFLFKVWPFFLHVCKCRTICRHSKNIISTSISCMVIHKLCYVFAPKQSLHAWNNGNITKNLVKNLFCYVICSLSTDMTFWTFCFKSMFLIVYKMVIMTCINCFILHSNLLYDDR